MIYCVLNIVFCQNFAQTIMRQTEKILKQTDYYETNWVNIETNKLLWDKLSEYWNKQTNNYDTYWVNIETNKLLIWDILYWDIESMIYMYGLLEDFPSLFFFSNSAFHPEIQIKMYSL